HTRFSRDWSSDVCSSDLGSKLPGMRFPARPTSFPTKDEMAEYLERYAGRFQLPVRTATPVRRVVRENGGYVVTTDSETLTCANEIGRASCRGRARLEESG